MKLQLIEHGPVKMFDKETIDGIAKEAIGKTTRKATMMSFMAGIPGGFAIVGTLPADTIQVYAMTLKLAQELSYLYGAEEIWFTGKEADSDGEDKLVVYLGVMLGVHTAAATTRLLSNTITKVLMEQGSQKVIHQSITNQLVKKVLKILGVKTSQKGLSSGMAKLIPLAGGVFSGGLTYFGVRPMGYKLMSVLSESAFDYDEQTWLLDFKEVTDGGVDIGDGENLSIEEISQRLESAKRLLDKKLISEETFVNLKKKLIYQDADF